MTWKVDLPVLLDPERVQPAVPFPQQVTCVPLFGVRLYGADRADREAATPGLVYTFRAAIGIDGKSIEIVDEDGVVRTLADTDTT